MSKEVSSEQFAGAVFSAGWHSTYGVLRVFGHPHGKMLLADSRCLPRIIGSMGFRSTQKPLSSVGSS